MRALFLQDETGRGLLRKDRLLYLLVAGFLITFYFRSHPVINNIFTGLIFVYSFFYTGLKEKWHLLRQRKAIFFMLLFFLLHLLSSLFSVNKQEAVVMLALRSPLLLFPLSLGLMVIKENLKDRILWLYAIVTSGAALVCLVWALVLFGRTGNAAVLYNDSLSDAIGKQSIYFALMINLAVFSLVYLLSVKRFFINRGLAYGCILFLLFIHFLLASRMAIIVLYSFLIGYACYYIVRRKKILEGAALLLGLVIGSVLLVKFFPKTFNRFRELAYTDYRFDSKAIESHYNMEVTADQWNGANIRLAVWRCGWELVKQHPVFGVQLGDKMDRLMETYATSKFDFAYKSRRNLHNNYLDVLVTFGFTGLLLFLAGFILWPLVKCIQTGDMFGIAVILVFALALVSETYIDRSIGSILLSFFISFVIGCIKPSESTS